MWSMYLFLSLDSCLFVVAYFKALNTSSNISLLSCQLYANCCLYFYLFQVLSPMFSKLKRALLLIALITTKHRQTTEERVNRSILV